MNRLLIYRNCGFIRTTITGKLLYLMLNEIADNDGEIVISQRRISNALQLSRSTVSRNLRRLEHVGAISITPTYHYDGGRAANKYRII